VPVGSGPGRVEVVYKRFNRRSSVGVFKNLLRRPPALRSWILGNAARDRGIPTARVLATFHRWSLGVPTTGYAVFETVPGAMGLPEAVAGLDRYRPADRRRILAGWTERLGRMLRTMHDRELAHRDLKAPNILMAGAAVNPFTATPVLIDLVGAEAGRPVSDATRIRDLARLAASFLDQSRVSRSDHLRLLRAYLGRGDWKSWWQRVARAARAKASRNARSGRPLG
jgi:tRNA A-37 threonylcarbamoyl transferase component Bud32